MVATFHPLAEVSRRVAGERAVVRDLTPPGAEPHDVELTPAQVEAIERARLVVYVGAGFQPAVERVVRRAGPRALDVLTAVDVRMAADATGARDGRETDPHVWLDPRRMIRIAERVAEALAEVDPAGAEAYLAGARTIAGELEALDAEMAAGLKNCDRRVIVSSHAAYGYLADRYGLVQHALAGVSPESEPNPRRLAELADLMAEQGVTTVFTAPSEPDAAARALAQEAGARVAVLNPLETLSDAELRAGKTYTSVMRENLTTLRVALGCR